MDDVTSYFILDDIKTICFYLGYINFAVGKNSALRFSCATNYSLIFNFQRYIWQGLGGILSLLQLRHPLNQTIQFAILWSIKFNFWINDTIKENI